MSVQDFDFRWFPFTLSDPNILVKKVFNSLKDINLLFGFFVISSFDLFFKIIDSVVDIFEILKNKFGVNNFHISDWVNWVFSMGDVFIFESSNNVINSIDLFDVAQEMVTQSLSLWSTSNQTCNINDLEDSRDFWFWFPHFA